MKYSGCPLNSKMMQNIWQKGNYTVYFTQENSRSIQRELLCKPAWFNTLNDIVRRIDNNNNSFLPIQSWKTLQSLVLGL